MHPVDEVTAQIISGAIAVHKRFGPGLLESVYTNALGAELVFDVHISKPVSLDHEGLHVHRAFVIDLLVDEKVIVEVKSVQKLTEIDFAQTLTYLRLMDIRVGLLINFNVPLLKHGLRRVVNRHVDDDGNKLHISHRPPAVEEVEEKIDSGENPDSDEEPTRKPPRPPRPPR
jgi:iron complex transport system substrate-binding protein